jgi:hypothetical protein
MLAGLAEHRRKMIDAIQLHEARDNAEQTSQAACPRCTNETSTGWLVDAEIMPEGAGLVASEIHLLTSTGSRA